VSGQSTIGSRVAKRVQGVKGDFIPFVPRVRSEPGAKRGGRISQSPAATIGKLPPAARGSRFAVCGLWFTVVNRWTWKAATAIRREVAATTDSIDRRARRPRIVRPQTTGDTDAPHRGCGLRLLPLPAPALLQLCARSSTYNPESGMSGTGGSRPWGVSTVYGLRFTVCGARLAGNGSRLARMAGKPSARRPDRDKYRFLVSGRQNEVQCRWVRGEG